MNPKPPKLWTAALVVVGLAVLALVVVAFVAELANLGFDEVVDGTATLETRTKWAPETCIDAVVTIALLVAIAATTAFFDLSKMLLRFIRWGLQVIGIKCPPIPPIPSIAMRRALTLPAAMWALSVIATRLK